MVKVINVMRTDVIGWISEIDAAKAQKNRQAEVCMQIIKPKVDFMRDIIRACF